MIIRPDRSLVTGACLLDCPDSCGVITAVENNRAAKGAGWHLAPIPGSNAAVRHIGQAQQVVVENGRGSIRLPAVVTAAIRPGVVASPKGYWPKLSGGHNLNWLTTDALADMAGQSTYHSTRVWVRPAT